MSPNAKHSQIISFCFDDSVQGLPWRHSRRKATVYGTNVILEITTWSIYTIVSKKKHISLLVFFNIPDVSYFSWIQSLQSNKVVFVVLLTGLCIEWPEQWRAEDFLPRNISLICKFENTFRTDMPRLHTNTYSRLSLLLPFVKYSWYCIRWNV